MNNKDNKKKGVNKHIGRVENVGKKSVKHEMPKINQETVDKLTELLLSEKENWDAEKRHTKLKKILTLLAKGTALYLMLTAPGSARLFRGFLTNNSDWKEWRFFNEEYLRRTINRLERQKLVEIKEENGLSVVKITGNGLQKVFKYSLNNLSLIQPNCWDRKWHLVFYDVTNKPPGTTEWE